MLMFKEKRVLRRQELDAFLATAVSPMLMDTEANQDMKVCMSGKSRTQENLNCVLKKTKLFA